MKFKWIIAVALVVLGAVGLFFILKPEGSLVKKEVYYSAEGEKLQTLKHRYKDGLKVRTDVVVEGGLKEYETFEYDNGVLVKSRFFKADGNERSYTLFSQNKEVMYNTSTKDIKLITVYDGNQIKKYDGENNLKSTAVTVLERENITEYTLYDQDGKQLDYKRFEYAYKGQKLIIKWEFDQDDNLISKTEYKY